MRKLTGFFFWTIIFLLILLAADQLLVQVKFTNKELAVVQSFYLDFRSRLFGLIDQQPSVESVIGEAPPSKPAAVKKAEPAQPAPRYLYVDRYGELHFADRLEDVPAAYRREAQPLSE